MTGTVMWRREPGSAGLDLGPFRVLAEANSSREVGGSLLGQGGLEPFSPRFTVTELGDRVTVLCTLAVVRMRRASDGERDGEHTSYLVDLELIQTA
jgi:hypothetical protein